jgi:hypothetical protein
MRSIHSRGRWPNWTALALALGLTERDRDARILIVDADLEALSELANADAYPTQRCHY